MRPALLGALCAALLGVGCASTAPAEPAAPASPAPAPLQRLTLPFSQVTPNNAPLAPPLGTIAERDGMRILADSADLGLPYANGVLSMQRDWLRAQRDVARRVLQSLLDGKRAFRADRELTLRTLQHWLRVDDLTLLAETYNYYSKVIDDRALPRPEALQTVIDEIAEDHPAARALQPEDLVDPSLASEVR